MEKKEESRWIIVSLILAIYGGVLTILAAVREVSEKVPFDLLVGGQVLFAIGALIALAIFVRYILTHREA